MISNERGSAIAYIFLAIFMGGLVMVSMTRDTSINVSTQNLQAMKTQLRADLNMIQSAVQECIQSYPDAVDLNSDGNIDDADNPNPPYPVYADLSTGSTGEGIKNIVCPGNGADIMTGATGRFLKLLDDPADYATTYYNDPSGTSDELITVAIQPTVQSLNWNEMAQQLQAEDSCLYETDTATGSCATQTCLTYYISRPTC
tara:strand:- start:1268 stop:1870 length:603 start_codon:yes stop_codon:yes gene_type:complete